jgi:hypothetical protein
MIPTNSTALTAAGGTPPSGPRIAQSSRDLEFHSSDGPGKTNRRNALPCVAQAAKRIQERAETANSLGVPGPSDSFQFAGHRSSRPANSRGFGSEPFLQNYGLARAQAGVDITRPSEGQYLGGPPSISPEFRERVAMAASFAFFGSIAVILGVAAFFVSMLIDWYGVAETGFRLFDFG